jgi:hypothetical protein
MRKERLAPFAIPFHAFGLATTGGRTPRVDPDPQEEHGMIFISKRACAVGTSAAERIEMGKAYHCDPTWLDDDLQKRSVELPAFWIDREPQIYHVSEIPAALNRRLLDWSRQFIEGNGPIERSRGFVIHVPSLGPWPICLFFAEALVWKDQQLLAGYQPSQPPLQRQPSVSGAKTYAIHFDELDVRVSFERGKDFLDLVSTITNKTDTPSKYLSGSCFSLTSHPYFYDCELLRTYQLTGSGELVPLRQLPRLGPCVRWITGTDLSAHGGAPDRGVMAVVSRDGHWTVASVRIEDSDDFNVIGNPWLSCLHTDARVRVGPRSRRVTRQRLYFIRGGVNDLKRRLERDVKRGDFAPVEGSSCP